MDIQSHIHETKVAYVGQWTQFREVWNIIIFYMKYEHKFW